jgi:hypothetical protein
MIKINFPKKQPKLRDNEGIRQIFDPVRKKWLLLTPEEWVRQNIICFLRLEKEISSSLISVEKEIKLGELKKRYDIVVYDRQTLPWMIIECKEMNVMLSEKTMDQILRYHISIPAKYLIITNGSHCFGFEKSGGQFTEINDFPDFIF